MVPPFAKYDDVGFKNSTGSYIYINHLIKLLMAHQKYGQKIN